MSLGKYRIRLEAVQVLIQASIARVLGLGEHTEELQGLLVLSEKTVHQTRRLISKPWRHGGGIKCMLPVRGAVMNERGYERSTGSRDVPR